MFLRRIERSHNGDKGTSAAGAVCPPLVATCCCCAQRRAIPINKSCGDKCAFYLPKRRRLEGTSADALRSQSKARRDAQAFKCSRLRYNCNPLPFRAKGHPGAHLRSVRNASEKKPKDLPFNLLVYENAKLLQLTYATLRGGTTFPVERAV